MSPKCDFHDDVFGEIRNSLRDIKKTNTDQYKILNQLRVDVAGLKVKSGVWGFLAGAVPALALLIWKVFG